MTVEDPPYDLLQFAPSSFTILWRGCGHGCDSATAEADKHWQLRSLLCSPAPNLLYYPTDKNIFALNPATKKREVVASLPFGPRCIGARYGWVCAGGVDNGQFASIRVGEPEKLRNRRQGSDEAMRELGPENAGEGSGISRRARPEVKITHLGGSIVNSVTLHRPPSSNSDDDVVAVLTNNDKTVRIFHLAQNRVLTTLVLDIATNHASISPDGQHLVVIGDCPIVYFYHPTSSSGSSCSSAPGMGIGEAGCEWVLYSHPPLTAGTDALISTSFSPSSLLCAVASQDGSITIFDTRYLSCTNSPGCPSPIVKRIPSSRPKTPAGAVRSVQFSPAPWDLLVWAEHSGRVCVADARSNFTKRQVVDILVEKDELVEAEIESVGEDDDDTQRSWRRREGSAGRRYTREEEDEDAVSANIDNVHAFFSRRFDELHELVSRVRGANSHELWDTPVWNGTSNYSPSNRPSGVAAATTNYPPYAPIRVPTSTQPSSASVPIPPTQPIHASTPALLRDHRERQLERERARQRIHDPPRRRNSTHPSYTDQSTSTSPASAQLSIPISASPTPTPPTVDASPSLQRFPWNTSSEPINTANARPLETMFTDHQRNREQLSALIAEDRRRGYIRRRAASGVPAGTVVVEDDGGMRYQEEGNAGVDITGCTLSRDGSKLYVATDGGIVEYHVDIAGRKVFPSLSPR
ncbi:hypothetical protein P167DRAFT_579222 [Morchella conica CCBAS932]|uniref:DUF2415 domain-containing protein n=1 Tax=Morchella conica CCBAS932 TaxID=1392247 RepID=A0A3N4KAD7_9PEZI|nr:hypothetical protein P167DRAFT_579222 [Morchella conica CCBAS932]